MILCINHVIILAMGILNNNVINVYIWFIGILLNIKNEIKCVYLCLIHCAPPSDPLCPRGGYSGSLLLFFSIVYRNGW